MAGRLKRLGELRTISLHKAWRTSSGLQDPPPNCSKHCLVLGGTRGGPGGHGKRAGGKRTLLCLRNRIRQYPALVNCTTIDWFSEWPKEALLEVAEKYLEGVDLGVVERGSLDTVRAGSLPTGGPKRAAGG